MRDDIPPELHRRARAMRENQTEAERLLWWTLRHDLAIKDTHFRRQVVIERAIVDFACVTSRMIIEVDGEQQGEERALAYDEKRTLALQTAGWRVLRFSNAQVMRERDQAPDTILAAVEGRL